ncbi:VOC family protein [Streptomyces sp. URMC 129]|uniref:VOC family protein n=1 Tax=Streptomyces sp. URMC 129 TaxID=3423407 RepID=UPI003F1AB404
MTAGHGPLPALAAGDGLDHVAFAVRDVDAALPWWTDVLGLRLVHDEVAEAPGSRLAYLAAATGGGPYVQLVQPVRANPVQDFLDTHGEGLHHVAFRVASLRGVLDRLGDPADVFTGGRGCRACFLTTAPTPLRVELIEEPTTARSRT